MDIKSCPACWGTNLDATQISTEHVTVICYDCSQVFEIKNTGLIIDEAVLQAAALPEVV